MINNEQLESAEKLKSDGTHQNISRTCLILEALAVSGKKGLRLTDVIQKTELKKTVVHRALTGLLQHGLVYHDNQSSHYFLGDRIFNWMMKAQNRFLIASRVKPYIESLAQDVEDTCLFSILRGDEMFCCFRAEGSFPVRTLTLSAGEKRPLGVGSGGVVLAAFLPEDRLDFIIESYREDRLRFNINDDLLQHNIIETRKNGYALHHGLFAADMLGLGFPVRNSLGEVVAAVAINALRSRLSKNRIAQIAPKVLQQIDFIEKELMFLLDEI